MNPCVPVKCTRCFKYFRSRRWMLSHLRRVHNSHHDIRGYRCRGRCGKRICRKTFSSINYLKLHKLGSKRISTTLYKCAPCQKDFLTKSHLAIHKKNVHNQRSFECGLCGSGFSSIIQLQSHLKSEHDEDHNNHRCLECGSIYLTREDLNCHIKNSHHDTLEVHTCQNCHKEFHSAIFLQDHIRRVHQPECFSKYKKKVFCCQFCGKLFSTNLYLQNHVVSNHQCSHCASKFTTKAAKTQHIINHNRSHRSQVQIGHNPNEYIDSGRFNKIDAFKGYLASYRFKKTRKKSIQLKFFNLYSIMNYLKTDLVNILKQSVRRFQNIKVQLSPLVTFMRKTSNGKVERIDTYMNSYVKYFLNIFTITDICSEMYNDLQSKIERFQSYGSGWIVEVLKGIDVRIAKFSPLRGACFIPTPKEVYAKKCVVNVTNYNSECFKYAVLSVLHPCPANANPKRISSYTMHENKYLWDKKWFPMQLQNIDAFELLNNIAVNIFGWSCEDKLYPLKISSYNYNEEIKVVNLLLLKNHKNQCHYAGITDLSRLIGKKNCHRRVICYKCLHTFSNKIELAEHTQECNQFPVQKVSMPKVDSCGNPPILKFAKIKNQLKAGFVIYADFECLLIKGGGDTLETHIPCGFGYTVIKDDGEVVHSEKYRNPDCVDVFFNHMEKWGKEVQEINKLNVPANVTREDEEKFISETHCFICQEYLGDDRVMDHCHRTGKIRGICHQICNLQFQVQDRVPIILHNFKNYDSNLIIHGFQKYRESENIFVLPINSEKTLSIICDKFYFIDSMQFLHSSLATLLQNLQSSCWGDEALKRKKFQFLYKEFKHENLVNLLLKKGVYPYSYFSSWEKFNEAHLPSKSEFFNVLSNSDISDEEYLHAQNVFSEFKCENLGDFHDIYLMGDVLQLACVFEEFRTMCLKFHKLDCVHYFSYPGFSFDSNLKMSKTKLELITDLKMYMLFERGIRGGVSMISQRYAKARNKYLGNQVKGVKDNYIMYYDQNNLYGRAMCEPLPVSDYEWVEDFTDFNVEDYDDYGEHGYVIDCNLSYPKELHDSHNQFPLAPDHINIPRKDLSEFQRHLVEQFEIDGFKYLESEKRLTGHFGPRENYVVHYRVLKFYLRHGMKLEKINSVLKFKQSPWMKEYILFNTEMRKQATNKFESDLHKYSNNSSFGKTIEQLRSRVNVKIVNDTESAIKYASRSSLVKWEVLDSELAYFVLQKKSVELNRPIGSGFTILDLSKMFMFEFHYEKMCKWYPTELNLLFSDTDSLAYDIQTDDIYEDMKQHLSEFDTANYPTDHKTYSNINNRKLGKMKDEFEGDIVQEAVCLCSKIYSLVGKRLRKKACKGTQKSVIDSTLNHKIFKRYLHLQKRLYSINTVIQSENHKLFTKRCRKVSLSPFDRKRYILNDGIKTRAFGHYKNESV